MTIVVQFPSELGVIAPERFAMGGMAEVYRAEKVFPQGGRYGVVVKHMLPQYNHQQEMVRRFRDEARLGLRLRHGNIARVLEYWEIDGNHYIVMERVDGYDLSEVGAVTRSAEVVIPEAVLAHFMASIASALAYMADATDEGGASLGLVHRDISPSNVLVAHGGAVKLIDFGVARAAEREARTATGHLVGKYAYMSPEQIVGDEIDIRSDLFALGTVAYELLTGRRAFQGGSDFETFHLVTGAEPPPLTLMRPGTHPILEAAVMRCLEKDPDDRYAHPEGLVVDLGRYFHDHVDHPPALLARQFLTEFEGMERIDLGEEAGLEEVSEPAVTRPVAPPGRAAAPLVEIHDPGPEPEAARVVAETPPDPPARRRGWKIAVAVGAAGLVSVVAWVLLSGPPAGTVRAQDDPAGGAVEGASGAGSVAEIVIEDDEPTPGPAGDGVVAAEPVDETPPAEVDAGPTATSSGARPTEPGEVTPAEERGGGDVASPPGVMGTISVSSIPWVDVWVDGERLGRTPLVDYPLPPGPHEFEYRNSERGWRRAEVVTIAPGTNPEIRIRLDE